MPLRFDRGTLRKPVRTDSGFLRADAYVTRVGVFAYSNADGTTRRELRHPDEVFDEASLATLELVPVTREHPGELVTDANAKQLQVGTTGERAFEAEGRYVQTALKVTDGETIEDILSDKRRDLSCGYVCDSDETPGVTSGIPGIDDGLEYDLVQRKIRYNHVAVTKSGRAGPLVSIPRMDAGGEDVAVMVEDSATKKTKTGASKMETIVIDGVEYEVSKQAAQAYRREQQKMDSQLKAAKKLADEQTARGDMAEKQRDDAKKIAEETKQKLDDAVSNENVRSMVAKRVRLVTDAKRVLSAHGVKEDSLGDLEEKSDREIMELAIEKAFPGTKLDDKNDDYVGASFDMVVKGTDSATTDSDTVDGGAGNGGRTSSRRAVKDALTNPGGGDLPDPEKARQKMIEDSEKAWQKDLNA